MANGAGQGGGGGSGDPVQRQYEAYPYPARDPADEARRLIAGSPSHPVEIDHFLFEGQRDWSRPFRALVAGGGTGDALVMLAQLLADRATPAELHYLDLSVASRNIAEARIAARGLSERVVFHTADLLTAPSLGPFDYIDCCGVLHHLPDPAAGFSALARALSPDGGLGLMVYAPDGRAGVYELQDALAPLTDGLPPAEQVAVARRVIRGLPPSHAFLRNPLIGDHRDSDAGLYDLVLHARDRPYRADALVRALEAAGLALAGFLEPARYDPATYLAKGPTRDRAAALTLPEQAALAERLAGNMKLHVAYAYPAARAASPVATPAPDRVPTFRQVSGDALARAIATKGALRFNLDGFSLERRVDRRLAPLAAAVDGQRSLAEVGQAAGLEGSAWESRWRELDRLLGGFNLLRYSRFERKN